MTLFSTHDAPRAKRNHVLGTVMASCEDLLNCCCVSSSPYSCLLSKSTARMTYIVFYWPIRNAKIGKKSKNLNGEIYKEMQQSMLLKEYSIQRHP